MFIFGYLSYDIVCKVKHFFYNILVIFIYNISRYFLIHKIEGKVTEEFHCTIIHCCIEDTMECKA